MNSLLKSLHQKSVGKNFPASRIASACFLAMGLSIFGCSSAEKQHGTPSVAKAKPDEYSLKSDREKLKELRKEVRPETQEQNDELAFILDMFQASKEQPYSVREKWNREVRRRRERFDKDHRKVRDAYSKEERKKREAYLKTLQKEREKYLAEKHSSEERSEFFSEHDAKRRDYFASEREAREEFESDEREKRKDFEDYIREKQGEFDQAYREYQKKYEESQRAARQKYERKLMQQTEDAMAGSRSQGATVSPEQKRARDEMKEFDEIPKGPGKPLGPVDDGN